MSTVPSSFPWVLTVEDLVTEKDNETPTLGATMPIPASGAEVEKVIKKVIDAGLLERAFEKTTVQGPGALSGGGDIIPRKRITFDVDGADCAPGVFVGGDGDPLTFQLTLATLTSAQEIKATRGVTDPAEAVQLTAMASLEQLNGAPVLGDRVAWLWEVLGPGGRQLVLTMYGEIGAISPAGMGKAQSSCIIR